MKELTIIEDRHRGNMLTVYSAFGDVELSVEADNSEECFTLGIDQAVKLASWLNSWVGEYWNGRVE